MPFNNYKTANNASGTPIGALSAGSTTLILTTGQGARFPSVYPYLLTIEERQSVSPFAVTKREIVKVTNHVGDTFTIVRSAGTCLPDDSSNTPGTTAFSFNTPAQTSVNLAVASEVTDDMQIEIARLETAKVNKAGDTLTGLLQGAKSTDIASAGTTNLATATGNLVHITGTTTITSFGTVTAGTQMTLIFDGILTLTHNATSLILPGGVSITTAVGDSAIFESEGSGNWKCVSYNRADGSSVISQSSPTTRDIITAGVTLVAGEHVRMGVSSIVEVENMGDFVDNGVNTRVGYDLTNQYAGLSFTTLAGPTGKQLVSVTLVLQKTGAPTGNLTLKAYSNTGTTLIGTSSNTIAESSLLTTEGTKVTFNFPAGINLSNSTQYYFRLETSRGNSTTNYTTILSATNLPDYTGGSAYYMNSSNNWFALGADALFIANIGYNEDVTRVYKTSAYYPETSIPLGVISVGGTAGNPVTIDTSGTSNTQTGLTSGSTYFYSDTSGAISLTPGRYRVIAGVADATTSIKLQPSNDYEVYDNVFTSLNSPTSFSRKYFHGLGKVPNRIFVKGYFAGNVALGDWDTRMQKVIGNINGSSTIRFTDCVLLWYGTSNYVVGVISAVNADTFTVTYTVTGTTTGASHIEFMLK